MSRELGVNFVAVSVSVVDIVDLPACHSDVSVCVWLGKRVKKYVTRAVPPLPRPEYNEFTMFDPVDMNDKNQAFLLLEVMGDNKEDLGFTKIPLSKLKMGQRFKGYFPLKGVASGKIMLVVQVNRSFHEQAADALISAVKQSGQKFTDDVFPHSNESVFRDASRPNRDVGAGKIAQWKRMYEFLPQPRLYIDGVESGDVLQGALGDCYAVGAMSIVSTHESLLQAMCTVAQPKHGLFVFKFFKNGRWCHVVIDDYMPLTKNGNFVFAHAFDKNETWVSLMEKAYAKLHGSWEALEGGTITQALMDFTGEAAEIFNWERDEEVMTQCKSGELFAKFEDWVNEEEFLVGCSMQRSDGKEEDMGRGILSGHAYAVLGFHRIKDESGTEVLLVKVRNPWGEKEWNGAWSDKSSKWTPWLRKALDARDENDGTFFIEWHDFLEQYNNLMMCRLLTDDIGHLWSKSEKYGSWTGSSSGGSSANRATWMNNHQYSLELTRETEMFMCLTQNDLRMAGEEKYPIGISIDVRHDESNPELIALQNTKDKSIVMLTYVKGREVSKSITLPAGSYKVVLSPYKPQEETTFYFVLYSYWPVSLNPIHSRVASVRGAWKNSGGSVFNTDTWNNNPTFALSPKFSSGSQVTLHMCLEQRDIDLPVAVYIVTHYEKGATIKPEQLLDQPVPMKNKVLLRTVTLERSQGPFALVAVAHDKGSRGDFDLRVISPMNQPYELE